MNKEIVIIKLVEKYSKDDCLLSTIADTLKSCSRYVDLITQQEVLVTVEKYNMSKDDLLEKITSLDKQRRTTHNVIISGIKLINRLCVLNKLDKFYQGDESDRYEIADFAMELVTSNFTNRKK